MNVWLKNSFFRLQNSWVDACVSGSEYSSQPGSCLAWRHWKTLGVCSRVSALVAEAESGQNIITPEITRLFMPFASNEPGSGHRQEAGRGEENKRWKLEYNSRVSFNSLNYIRQCRRTTFFLLFFFLLYIYTELTRVERRSLTLTIILCAIFPVQICPPVLPQLFLEGFPKIYSKLRIYIP